MQIAILLTLIIIVVLLLKKYKSQPARIIVGAVFGIIFFTIWPYIVFYIEAHNLSESYNLLYYSFVSILAVFLSYFLVRIKQELITASFVFFLFSITAIYSLSFESNIKNKIAIYTGYFNDNNVIPKNTSTTNLALKQRKIILTHNYLLYLNNNWKKKTHKGPFFEHYHFIKNGSNFAELRPKCFSTGTVSLPEIVKNAKHIARSNNVEVKDYCYKISELNFACKVSSLDENRKARRIRWFSFNVKSNYGVELDFVVFKEQKKIAREIEEIISSTKIKDEAANKKMICLGLTEWM